LAGFIPFLLLLVMGIKGMKRAFAVVPDDQRHWVWASIAALAAVTVQGVFDDATFVFFPMVLIVFHAASIYSQQKNEQRFRRGSLLWMAIPALIAACITGFNIWTNLPLDRAEDYAREGNLAAAIQEIEQSLQRDQTQPGYINQAGLTWARLWGETGDPQALTSARNYFESYLSLDSGNSLVWANLSVLDWQAGRRELALSRIQKAIDLSPTEPLYWLNYASFLEQLDKQEEAVQQYQRVIFSKPAVTSHPFWESSPIREQALNAARDRLSQKMGTPYWMLARIALDGNDFPSARLNLALSGLYRETPSATAAGWVEFARREGTTQNIRDRFEALVNNTESNYWGFDHYLFQRFPYKIVPGFMKIEEDGGQFAALEELLQIQINEGDCEAAVHTWAVLQRELRAGEWSPQGYPPAPACP
jgi:tetratricopeptide (TPR) repeat protein